MSASRNQKYALKHASPSRVESVRRALDEAEDKAGVRLRQATETLTIAASALLGLVWVSIVALFGLKLKAAYDIETFWVAVPLVCVAVAVWFALVFVDVFLIGREGHRPRAVAQRGDGPHTHEATAAQRLGARRTLPRWPPSQREHQWWWWRW